MISGVIRASNFPYSGIFQADLAVILLFLQIAKAVIEYVQLSGLPDTSVENYPYDDLSLQGRELPEEPVPTSLLEYFIQTMDPLMNPLRPNPIFCLCNCPVQ